MSNPTLYYKDGLYNRYIILSNSDGYFYKNGTVLGTSCGYALYSNDSLILSDSNACASLVSLSDTIDIHGANIYSDINKTSLYYVADIKSKILICGGYDGTNFLNTVEVFDQTTQTFTALSNKMASIRIGQTTSLLPNGDVLICGGATNFNTGLNSAEIFNINTQTFTMLSSIMTSIRMYPSATTLSDGAVLICGGSKANDSCADYLDTAEIYNPSTQTFTALSNKMTMRRRDQVSILLRDNKVLICGGDASSNGSTSVYSNTAEIYDPSTQTFTALSNKMTTARVNFSATLLNDGNILICGGIGSGYLNSAEIYNPITQTFTALSNKMTTVRYGHTTTLLPNGTVLICGGDTGTNKLNTAEIYDPSTQTFTALSNKMTTIREYHSTISLSQPSILQTITVDTRRDIVQNYPPYPSLPSNEGYKWVVVRYSTYEYRYILISNPTIINGAMVIDTGGNYKTYFCSIGATSWNAPLDSSWVSDAKSAGFNTSSSVTFLFSSTDICNSSGTIIYQSSNLQQTITMDTKRNIIKLPSTLPSGVTNYITYTYTNGITYLDSLNSGYLYLDYSDVNGTRILLNGSGVEYTLKSDNWVFSVNIQSNVSIGYISKYSNLKSNIPIYTDINKTGFYYNPSISQTVNIDTSRSIKNNQIITVDTKRDIKIGQVIVLDTVRKIKSNGNPTIDTKRIINTSETEIITIDTQRKIKGNNNFNIDTCRKTKQSQNLILDSKRIVQCNNVINIDSKRIVKATSIVAIDTERIINQINLNDKIEFYTKIDDRFKSDILINKIICSFISTIPSDWKLSIQATNNALDVTPLWEDITEQVKQKQTYTFNNTTKTGDKYCIQLHVIAEKNNSTINGNISAIGFYFEQYSTEDVIYTWENF